MPTIRPNLLFVYGTLRKGFGNHYFLQGAAEKGNGEIEGILYASGMLPMIAEGKGVVKGEVYEIPTSEMWYDLDALEGHPTWYVRQVVEAIMEDGTSQAVWAYFMRPSSLANERVKKVPSGDYAILRQEWAKES